MISPFAGRLEPREAADPVRADGGGWAEFDGVLCHLDGAVYDLAELGAELEIERPARAEEVLARGFRRWGAGLAPRLRGEFTLLVWDRRARRGLLVPDQLGVRRIFFRREGGRLWFASEVAELLAVLPRRPGPDPVAVAAWLGARPAPRGATLYAGIDCLGPGQMLEVGPEGGRVVDYWRPRPGAPLDLRGLDLVEAIRETLERAVARRATPGAPLGVMMSGGLDSTSVAALALRGENGAIAYSATFPGYPSVDESAWVDTFAESTGICVVRHAAEPRGLLAASATYMERWQLPLHAWSEAWAQPLLRRAAGDGVVAMLSGEGGDELFGSRLALTADRLRGGDLRGAVGFARGLPEAGGRAPRRVLAHVLWKYGVEGVLSARRARAWGRGDGTRWQEVEGPRWWALLVHALTDGVHGFGLLDHVRRRTEMNGIEARHPLLDLDLFELMLRVPPEACSAGVLTRPLLREAMAGISPDTVRLRPDKSVFDALVTDALLGPELPAIRAILGDPRELGPYADLDQVRTMVEHPPAPHDPRSGAWGEEVLRLTAIELWLRAQG